MKIGIIGLNNSGKSTIFSALTNIPSDISPYSAQRKEPVHGIVEVVDKRIDFLTDLFLPKKKIYAFVEFLDFPGLSSSEDRKDIFSASSLAAIKTADALSIVLRNFNDLIIDESLGAPEPVSDYNMIESELIISDLIIVENRLAKIELSKKRGIKDNLLLLEEQCLLKAESFLNSAKPLRDIDLSQEEEKVLRGFKFLTQKPVMLILNSDESSFSAKNELLSELSQKASILEFAGKFELELTNLSPEDAAEFMKDMGIEDSARNRLVKFSYDLLGYISFFTVGKDEVRAWTIEKNRTAVEAAGKIHSDLERGFIRAECYNYEDIFQHKSEKKLREIGLIRLEGKNYLVQDGDILNIRFNV